MSTIEQRRWIYFISIRAEHVVHGSLSLARNVRQSCCARVRCKNIVYIFSRRFRRHRSSCLLLLFGCDCASVHTVLLSCRFRIRTPDGAQKDHNLMLIVIECLSIVVVIKWKWLFGPSRKYPDVLHNKLYLLDYLDSFHELMSLCPRLIKSQSHGMRPLILFIQSLIAVRPCDVMLRERKMCISTLKYP